MKAISEGTHKWYFFRTLDDTIRVKANRLCEKKVKGKNQYILLKNEETVATIEPLAKLQFDVEREAHGL